MTEKEGFSKEKQQFLNHLQNVVDIIASNQSETVIVGGIALRAAMNKPVEFQRSNGTTPDIDIIGLGPNPENLKKTIKEIDKYRKSFPNCPAVGLEPVYFSNQVKKNYSPLEMVSGLRKDDNGRYFLTFRSLDQEISPLTMLPFTRQYGEVNISTLSQETIYYRYRTRVGFLKPKDEIKTKEFCDHINKTGGDHIDPTLFLPYVEFCQRINEKHPLVVKISKAYWNFDQKNGGKISGSNGFVYSLIKSFRR